MGGPIEATVTPFGGAAIPDFWCSQAPPDLHICTSREDTMHGLWRYLHRGNSVSSETVQSGKFSALDTGNAVSSETVQTGKFYALDIQRWYHVWPTVRCATAYGPSARQPAARDVLSSF